MRFLFTYLLLLLYTFASSQQFVQYWKGGEYEMLSQVDSITFEEPIIGTTKTFTVNGVSFKMIGVTGGYFNMGGQAKSATAANYDKNAQANESPVHQVFLSSYSIAETEVTQALWKAVTGKSVSSWTSKYGLGAQYPAYFISYSMINDVFLPALNDYMHKNGLLPSWVNFTLPTEAQWEFAARGGIKSKNYIYSGSNVCSDVAWFSDNDPNEHSHPVKTKKANELGLYDMSGNVYEWVRDAYTSYSGSFQKNPLVSGGSSQFAVRSGSWWQPARKTRVSYRGAAVPSDTYTLGDLGFRIALSAY